MILRTQSAYNALTANGGTTGILTVTSTAGFLPGARAVVGSTAGGTEVIIIAVPSTTTLQVRDASVRGSQAGTSMAAFTTAQTAYVSQAAEQLVDILPQNVPVTAAVPVRTT